MHSGPNILTFYGNFQVIGTLNRSYGSSERQLNTSFKNTCLNI